VSVLQYFRDKGKLHEVDAARDVDLVYEDMRCVLLSELGRLGKQM
jgi:adenylate kinase family enzyme